VIGWWLAGGLGAVGPPGQVVQGECGRGEARGPCWRVGPIGRRSREGEEGLSAGRLSGGTKWSGPPSTPATCPWEPGGPSTKLRSVLGNGEGHGHLA
jgi:hypothetical protein